MGVSGQFVNRFSEGNLALVTDIHCNADYPHHYFDVVVTDGKTVTLKNGSTQLLLPIHRTNPKARKHAFQRTAPVMEYVEIEQSSTFEKIYRRPPQKFKVFAFKGART
jgi:hypothetical protein